MENQMVILKIDINSRSFLFSFKLSNSLKIQKILLLALVLSQSQKGLLTGV